MDKRKIAFIQQRIKNHELFLISEKSDLFYLTGYSFDGYFLGITKKNVYFFVPLLLYSQIKTYFSEEKIFVTEKIVDKLNQVEENITKFLVSNSLQLKLLQKIKKHCVVKPTELLSRLREIKTQQEIENIKTAAEICKKILLEVNKKLSSGVTEEEMKNFILKKFLDYNVEPAFNPIVAFDENTMYPHHISGNKKFKINSLVLIDIGCKYKGYCCDITRMVNVEKDKNIFLYYKLLTKLQKKLISMCKEGITTYEIDRYAREYVKKLGFKKNYVHSTGHGVGIDIHESPRISIKDKTKLKNGMVITIEPGIYFEDKKFGLRIEDTVLITNKNPIVLSY